MIESIIDIEVIEEYEKETGKQWREEAEERMAAICSFYGYGFAWNEKGNIVINNDYYLDHHQEYYKFFGRNIEKDTPDGVLRHYEYESAEAMVEDWLEICRESNVDYIENGQEKPFEWL